MFSPFDGAGLVLLGGLLGLGTAGTVFWVWMLIDCVTREPATGDERLAWALVIAFTHLIGAFAYLFVRRPVRIRLHGV